MITLIRFFIAFTFVFIASPYSVRAQAANQQNDILRCLNGGIAASQLYTHCSSWISRLPPQSPLLESAYLQRAMAAYKQGLREQAMTDVDVVLRLNPAQWPAHWAKAQWQEWSRNYTGAIASWAEVIRYLPNMGTVYARSAAAYDNAGRSEEALEAVEKALSRAEGKVEQANFRFTYGLIQEGRGDYAAAKAAFATSLELMPDFGSARYALGRAQYMTGEFRAAMETLDKSGFGPFPYLWRYLAALRAGEAPIPMLAALPATMERERWPVSLVRELQGEGKAQPELGLQKNSSWSEATQLAGRQVELAFFQGQIALARGDKTEAARLFKNATSAGFEEYIETRAARVELSRLRAEGVRGSEP
ncbi:tetratricopeptide repeat protein [Ferrovibrio sp.]|uniref:tetratricopeptide repeat protein n=1 Tax=Ferrovibrio sp. TaxID=1917215 RepID=UPI003D0CAAEC